MKKPIMLQYTIDEEQLPAETYRLLGSSIERLMSISAETPDEKEMLTVTTMNEVNSLRQEIAGIDTMLGDVSSIIDQYLQYQFETWQKLKNSDGEIELPDEYEIPVIDDVDLSDVSIEDLKFKLQQAQDMQATATSMEDVEKIFPEINARQVKVSSNPEQFESDNDLDSVRDAHDQLSGMMSGGNFNENGMTPEQAKQSLSMLNDIDFSDLDNIGAAINTWKTKIGQ